MEDPLRIVSLKRMTIPKVAVLVMGLTAAVLVATINPAPAQAYPNKSAECIQCHGTGTVAGTVTAVPSTTTPAAGATYTVLITPPANAATSGNSGFWIANSTAAGATGTSTGVYGGDVSPKPATYTATMTAPAAAGTYYYKVWADNGTTSDGVVNFKVYSITVAGAPVVVTTTTALGVTPASPVVAPASPTLKATVTGTGAAGTVEFFNGTTSLGTSAVSAGVATKVLSGIAAGSYSYHAVFTPTDAAAFTSSTSGNVAFTVTVPAPTVVTTTTALAMSPTSVTAVAPAAKTLTATVTGAGAAGVVEFFNGTASLGTSPVAAGTATKALTAIAVGSYSYHAVFTPTDATLFTSSTSGNAAFTVTASVPALTASFTASAIAGVAPLAVTLTDTSIGAPTSWLWTFGNGSSSNAQNPPVANYTAAGTYNVTLIVSNANGASAPVTKTITVTDVPGVVVPVSSFTSAASATDPLTVAMTDTSSETPTSWAWDLGNNTTSTLQSPSVTYTTAGTYTVTLTATNANGAGTTATKTVTVTSAGTHDGDNGHHGDNGHGGHHGWFDRFISWFS